ncbi:MAG: IS1634 family transposase [Thermoplasmata archaeon]
MLRDTYTAIKHHRRNGRCYREEWRTYRRGGKVVSEYVRYLGLCPEHSPKDAVSPLDRVSHGVSSRAGAVRLLWSVAEGLEFRTTIDRICGQESDPAEPSPGRTLTVWAINRVLDPTSATRLELWTPTTDLPLVSGVPSDAYTKDTFLRALDRVSFQDPAIAQVVDRTIELEEALSRGWRERHPLPKGEKEVMAYDLTSVLFFGVTCPIATSGRNPDHQNRLQVNVGAVVSRHDRMLWRHFVYRGNRHGAGTMRNLLVELQRAKVPPGLLIVDRGLVGKEIVEEVQGVGWQLLGGLSKTLKEVRQVLDMTKVPETHGTFVQKTRTGAIYAVKARAPLWKTEREVVVYTNADHALDDRNERNQALSTIDKALTTLAKKGKDWAEKKLHEAIEGILGEWTEFVQVRVRRGGAEPRIAWSFREQAVKEAARRDGKYVLLCTEARLTAPEVVEQYLGKDFVEKAFRTWKTGVEVEPVRHRRERRVRAYLFVCGLAYRLEMALRWKLLEGGVDPLKVAEYQTRLLEELGRVERTEVSLGAQFRTWYLNITDRIKEGLRRVGQPDLLKEGQPMASVPT